MRPFSFCGKPVLLIFALRVFEPGRGETRHPGAVRERGRCHHTCNHSCLWANVLFVRLEALLDDVAIAHATSSTVALPPMLVVSMYGGGSASVHCEGIWRIA
jgi:hypothetical protein